MKRWLALAAVPLLAGCAYSSVRVSSEGGTTTSTAGASVRIGTRSGLGLALVGMALVVGEQARRDEAAARPGPLDPGRRIHEQDCTQPIQDPSANLRCR